VAMFMLLGLLFFLKRFDSSRFDLESPKRSNLAFLTLSLVSLILALLSRETAIIFPFLALSLYVSAISKERFLRSVRQGLNKTWPYFAVVFVYGILRLTSLNFLDTLNFYEEPNLYSENLYVRFFTFLPILWEYFKLLVAPAGLHMERGGIVYDSLFRWPVWPIFLGLAGFLAWLRHLYKKQWTHKLTTSDGRRTSDVTDFQIWFLGAALFFIPLGPVSGITPINALMYEHWLYLPMVGFWLIVSFYLVKLLDFKGPTLQGSTLSPQKGRTLIFGRTLVIAALVAYLSFFSYQSIQRNILWGRTGEFYKDILKYEPESARISNNLGNLYYNQGDKEQAEFYYRKAVEVEDVFAQPFFNLGAILQSKGDMFGAIQLYEKAIEINPSFYYPYQNLSFIYAQQGNLIKAVENIEVLKSLLPTNARIYYNSALVYLALNNKEQALTDLKEGLKHVSVDPETGRLIEELIQQLTAE